MSVDSVNQWQQAATFRFGNAHPIFSSLLLVIFRMIYPSPATAIIVQIAISSLLAAWISASLLQKGRKKALVLGAFALFVLSPSIGIYNVTLWKDVFYSQAVVALALYWYDTYPKPTKNQILIMSCLAFILSLLRHNGVIFLLALPLLLLCYRQIKVKIFAILISGLLVGYFVINAAFSYLPQNENKSTFDFALKTQIVGAIVTGNARLRPDEISTIEKVMPIQTMKERYSCSTIDRLLLNNLQTTNRRFFQTKLTETVSTRLFIAWWEKTCLL